MSLERACVNCERCFLVASEGIADRLSYQGDFENYARKYVAERFKAHGDGEIDPEELESAVLENPSVRKALMLANDELREEVYGARNEAMKALWDVIKMGRPGYRTIMFDYRVSMVDFSTEKIAADALQACRSCDYSAPRIVEVVERLSKKEE